MMQGIYLWLLFIHLQLHLIFYFFICWLLGCTTSQADPRNTWAQRILAFNRLRCSFRTDPFQDNTLHPCLEWAPVIYHIYFFTKPAWYLHGLVS